ncbi:MAG: ATP-binding protein [Hyphomonadaceae bacterium]|nr:ATP-binding protein [Hyphomonadaceae bacterium]
MAVSAPRKSHAADALLEGARRVAPALGALAAAALLGAAHWALGLGFAVLAAVLWARGQPRQAAVPAAEAEAPAIPPPAPVGWADLAPLLEALPDPALLVDREGRIVGSNGAARRQLRFEAAGLRLSSILRQPAVLDAAAAAAHDGQSRTVEYQTAAQVDEHFRCYVAPIAWGAQTAALIAFHDETARINTERMRADFLANASHELRTPVAAISALIETLAGPARDDTEARARFLRMMELQVERMRRLIDDLLSLSRIELDEHVPPTDRADLAAVAREVVDAMAPIARDRDVRLALEGLDAVDVIGERFQLAQVVQNLVDNAIKYSPAGGVVTITLGEAANREEAIEQAGRRWPDAGRISLLTPAQIAPRYAYVRVTDHGAGIGRRFLPRLGERFFRAERELGADKGGTGLGLAIVKHIVNRHRGGFLVESRPGEGSAFAVYLRRPRRTPEAVAAPTQS